MAKNRTPTNVLALRGSDKVHPERARERENEPEPEGEVGPPPDHLETEVRAAWVELVKHAHAGVLCAADAPFMEYSAKVWAEVKASRRVDPKLGIRFEAVCSRLGMTPADRSRVSVIRKPKGKNADPIGEFQAAG